MITGGPAGSGPVDTRSALPTMLAPITLEGGSTSRIVTTAVSDIGQLDGLADTLAVQGIVVSAVNHVVSLSGIGSAQANSESGAVPLTDIRAWQIVETLERVGHSPRGEVWDPRGLTGFSLRINILEGVEAPEGRGQIVVESLVREKVLIVQFSNTHIDAARSVQEFRFSLANGSPLPNWLDRAGPDLLLGQRPANVDFVEIRVTIIFTDGSFEEKYFRIEAISGDIKPLTSQRQGGIPPSFADQFASFATFDAQDVELLGSILRGT